MGSNKFMWRDGDVVINRSCEIAVIIDGQSHPWYRASWAPSDDLDVALHFESEMSGAPTFNPSDEAPTGGPTSVEQVLLTGFGQWGVSLTRLEPVPDGIATELRLTGDAEVTVPLGG